MLETTPIKTLKIKIDNAHKSTLLCLLTDTRHYICTNFKTFSKYPL